MTLSSKHLIPAIAACGMLLTAVPKEARSAEPQGVVRTFAIWVFEPVDFTDDDSVLVKVEKSDTTSSVKQYGDPGDPDFDGTVWVFGSPSGMYITKGGGDTPVGGFAWLISEENPEPPPVGSVALTGPDAPLIQETLGHVRAEGDYILPTTDTTRPVMIVVTAVFSQ